MTLPPSEGEKAGMRGSLDRIDGLEALTWNVQAGTNHVVQFKAQLGDASWTTLTNFTADASSVTGEDTASRAGGQRFYRIVAGP